MENEANNQPASAVPGDEQNNGAGIDPQKDVLIHSMPKRFLKSAPSTKNTKGMGILILAGGGLLLIAGLVFVYYYFVYSKNPAPAVIEEAVVETEEKIQPEEEAEPVKKEKTLDQTDEGAEEDMPVKTATTTESEADKAAAAEESATGTAKVIQISTTTQQAEYKEALDSDNDGLADLEEILFDCNIDAKDSDGDGYDDLSEILNLYNPAGGGSLMVNPNIEKYINSRYGYSVYYPYVWQVDNLGGDESIIFKAGNNQFVQIIVQENPDKALLDDWYLEQMKLDEIESDRKIYKKGWQAIKSNDGLTIYLAKPGEDKIYVISYNLGASGTLNFMNVFNMMMKSFEVD